MKKFLCGLLVGILLMVSVPAFSAVGQQVTEERISVIMAQQTYMEKLVEQLLGE